MLPRVSVIMPAYNAEQHIAQSIQSVLDQTYQNWELVVVNDGSTDKTFQIVRHFLSSTRRIKYVSQQKKGPASARNTGIDYSTGELIAFLDSDDLWVREKLDLQVKTIEAEKADLVFSDGFIFSDNKWADETSSFGTITGRFRGAEMLPLLFVQNRIPVLSVLTRRATLNQVGIFDEDHRCHASEDYDLWLRMAKHGAAFYGMEEKLVRYRVHAGGISRNEVEMLKAWNYVLKKYKNEGSIDEKVRRDRYKSLAEQTASNFVNEGRWSDAIKYSKDLSDRDKIIFAKLLATIQLDVYVAGMKSFLSRCYCSCIYRTKAALRILGINSR